MHFDKRPDGRRHVVYTLRGRNELERKLLSLLYKGYIAGEFESSVAG